MYHTRSQVANISEFIATIEREGLVKAGLKGMAEILTDVEEQFLARHSLGPEDVFDARRMPSWLWKKRIREENKTIALGTACGSGGHRLRTRAGHCVQCDPKKLAFQARHHAEQYVYIAGSQSAQLIKIGTCKDVAQRERQIRAEGYGGEHDWKVIFSIKVRSAGEVEHRARSILSRYVALRPYWKDGVEQLGIELIQCSFSHAKEALMSVAEAAKLGEPWKARFTLAYEFEGPT
jgi:hypothetical protein